MRDVEQPRYVVVSSLGDIEIRQYAPMTIAEVRVKGERKEAISNGFRLLADYIFGNNNLQEKIAMMAPVQQQSSDNQWLVSFVMPSTRLLANLPTPNNQAVTLKQLSAKQFIAIEFAGSNTNSTIAKYEKQLLEYSKANQVHIIGSAKYAFYNSPWTLPSLRRNEVMYEIHLAE